MNFILSAKDPQYMIQSIRANGKSCAGCNRTLMKPNAKYEVYKSTHHMFCNSNIGEQCRQQCPDCKCYFMTDDCFNYHRKVCIWNNY